MIVALLTAAGSGMRMGQDIPKQFIHVEGKPIIIHTMEAFQRHPSVDAILVVTLPAWIEVLKAYAHQFNITKLQWIIPGGATGQESIHNGLMKLKDEISEAISSWSMMETGAWYRMRLFPTAWRPSINTAPR